MVVAHIYVGDKNHRQFMAHAPRVGDTLRMPGGACRQVTEVIWCLDESPSTEVSRVNIRTVEAPPPPVVITAAMVAELRKLADCSMDLAKAALKACNGDLDAALLRLINLRNG